MGLAEAVLTRGNSQPLEERALQVTPWGPWGYSSAASSGVNVTTDSSLQLLTVYGCVSLIADTIATLPRDVFRNRADGSTEQVTNTPTWFDQPSATVDMVEFITQTLLSLLLDGNAYWVYGIDGNFAPTTIRVLDPARVEVRDDGHGNPIYAVNGETYRGKLFHIKGITRPGALKGMSPVEAARQSIGLGLGAQEFAGRFYSNGTTMSGVIETPGDLTADQAKIMASGFSRDHGGLSKSHLPGVLTNGATWTQISITPEQAQFLQAREYQAAEIAAQLFLVDPSMLGIAINRGQNLTYANLEQRGVHLVQFTLMRWIIRLEHAFTFLLPKPQYQKFNVNALMRADLASRMAAHRVALGPNQPFETVDEVRGLEELPPVPGGNKIEIVSPAPAPTFNPLAAAAPNGKTPVGATK